MSGQTSQSANSTFNGFDWSNNLLSDLGPLLALFGEQVARQYMSESTGWADSIAFAMAPLGIITAMVGAIRVGGPPWLKATIGRARENKAVAESELMSSTSWEVCELWNGQQIVRIFGCPSVCELISLPILGEDGEMKGWDVNLVRLPLYSESPNGEEGSVGTLSKVKSASEESGGTKDPKLKVALVEIEKGKSLVHNRIAEDLAQYLREIKWLNLPPKAKPKEGSVPELPPIAPNISLNLYDSSNRVEIYIIAAIGVFLQGLVLVYVSMEKYYFHWNVTADGHARTRYGLPLTMIGTLLLVSGMLICAYVVESSTVERRWEVKTAAGGKSKEGLHVLWVQRSQDVSDQHFESYVIIAKGTRPILMTSRRREHERMMLDHERMILDHENLFKKTGNTAEIEPTQSQGVRKASVQLVPSKIVVHADDRYHGASGAHARDAEAWIDRAPTLDASQGPGDLYSKLAELLAVVGSFISVGGYICQFTGFRAMHWTVTIAQLLATVVMSGLRVFVRRGLVDRPLTQPVRSHYEIDWLATRLVHDVDLLWNGPDPSTELVQHRSKIIYKEFWKPGCLKWGIVTGIGGMPCEPLMLTLGTENSGSRSAGPKQHGGEAPGGSVEQSENPNSRPSIPTDIDINRAAQIVRTRVHLAKRMDWPSRTRALAVSVAASIEVVLNCKALYKAKPDELLLTWWLHGHYGQKLPLTIARDDDDKPWCCDIDTIEAIFSLWLFSVDEVEEKYRNAENGKWKSLRLLGRSTESLRWGLEHWIPAEVLEVTHTLPSKSPLDLLFAAHRVVGCSGQDGSGIQGDHESFSFRYSRLGHTSLYSESSMVEPDRWSQKEYVSIYGTTTGGPDSGLFGGDVPGLSNDQQEPLAVNPHDTLVQSEHIRNWVEQQRKPSVIESMSKDTTRLIEEPMLATISDAPLPQLYAQEIFSSFMFTFAKSMEARFKDDVKIQPMSSEEAGGAIHSTNTPVWQLFTLESPIILDLATNIERTGLGTLHDAYFCLIPPLAAEHKLPEVRSLIDLAERNVLAHTAAGRTMEGALAYEWLFTQCRLFEDHEIKVEAVGIEATAMMVEFLLHVQNKEAYMVDVLYPRAEVDILQQVVGGLMRQLKQEAQEPMHRVLRGLNRLLARQKRAQSDFFNDSTWGTVDIDKFTLGELGDESILGFSRFHHLVASGQSYWVAYELAQGAADPRQRDILHWTPLHYAAVNGDEYIANLLLCNGAEVNAIDRRGFAPLHYAAQSTSSNDLGLIHLLVEKGADIHLQGRDGTTALHWAIKENNELVVQHLLELGSDVNVQDIWIGRQTPLHWAVFNGSLSIVEYLLQYKAAPHKRGEHGRTPIHTAAIKGNGEIALRLLKAGASPDARDSDRATPLHLAMAGWQHSVVDVLLDSSADPHAIDSAGRTPLHRAVQKVTGQVLKGRRLEAASSNVSTSGGITAIVNLVQASGGHWLVEDAERYTPLMRAAESGNHAVISSLLADSGEMIYNPAVQEVFTKAFSMALRAGHLDTTRMLLAAVENSGAGKRGFSLQVAGLEPVDWFLVLQIDGIADRLFRQLGTSNSHQNKIDDASPLWSLAALSGQAEVVTRLKALTSTTGGLTPIHLAAIHGDLHQVKRILASGEQAPDVNVRDAMGRTPLHWAVAMGSVAVVECLIEARADLGVESADDCGCIPKDYAPTWGPNELTKPTVWTRIMSFLETLQSTNIAAVDTKITDLLVSIQETLAQNELLMTSYNGNDRLLQQLQHIMELQRSPSLSVNDLDELPESPEAHPLADPPFSVSPDLHELVSGLLTKWDPNNRKKVPNDSTCSINPPAPNEGSEILHEHQVELQALLVARERIREPLVRLKTHEDNRMRIAQLLRDAQGEDTPHGFQPISHSEWVRATRYNESKFNPDVNFNPLAVIAHLDLERNEATWKTLLDSKGPGHLDGSHAIALAQYCLNSAVLADDPQLRAMISAGSGLESYMGTNRNLKLRSNSIVEMDDDIGITRAVTEGEEVTVAVLLSRLKRPLDTPTTTAIQNAMRVAVGQGRAGIVRMLLDSNRWDQNFAVQGESSNASILTLLDLAASKGHADVVRLLLASNHTGALGDNQFVSKTLPEHARNAIRMAAQNGHLHTVQALVKAIAESQTKLDLLNTTLFIAIKARRDAIVRYILNAGADINARSRNPNDPPSPLACAIQRGLHDSVIQFMVNAGANLEVQDNAQQTPLFIAAKDGQRLKSVLALLDHGANLEHRDGNGNTFLHIASSSWDPFYLEKLLERSEVQRLLLVTNKEGKIPEQVAVSAPESCPPYCVSSCPSAKSDRVAPLSHSNSGEAEVPVPPGLVPLTMRLFPYSPHTK